MKKLFFAVIFTSLLFSCSEKGTDRVDNNESKIDSIIALMTIEEKIGQMTQIDQQFLDTIADLADYSIGSLLSGGGSNPDINNFKGWADMYDKYQEAAMSSRLGIPLIYGVDAVHGHNNVLGATMFPHNVGLGCANDYELCRKVSEATAIEVAATGINWNFSPCIAIPQDERWGRHYEGYSEHVDIVSEMGEASIIGYQTKELGSVNHSVVACAKHFIADGATIWGTGMGNNPDKIDRGNAPISDSLIRAKYLPPYQKALDAGVGTVMASFNSINDLKCHANGYLFNDLLKDNAILIINKSDLINGELDPEINKLDHVLISLKENKNLDKLISKIKNKLKTKFIINDDVLITRERHRQHLVHCSDNLKNFLEKNDKKDFDKAAEDLRLASRNLGMIVGKVDVEEILGSIFNDFCIGK